MTVTVIIDRKPVSGNRRLIHTRGRMIASPTYAEYKRYVWAMAKMAMGRRAAFKKDVDVAITLGPQCARLDIDSPIKVLLDGMQGAVYENDRQVKWLAVDRNDFAEWAVTIGVGEKE